MLLTRVTGLKLLEKKMKHIYSISMGNNVLKFDISRQMFHNSLDADRTIFIHNDKEMLILFFPSYG